MRLRAFLIITLMAFTVVAAADERWIAFTSDSPYSEARIETGRSGSEVVEFDLVIPGVKVETIATANGDFSRLMIPGLGRIGDIGAPELPALRRFVEVPQGATAEVHTTILERSTVDLGSRGLPTMVYPVQLPIPKCDCPEARAWRFSQKTEAYKGVVGINSTGLEGPYDLRDHHMMMLTAAPATYDVAAGSVEIATRMRVTVTISGGDTRATTNTKERLSSRHFDAFLQGAALNLNLTRAGGWAYPDDAPVEFLIITPPQFVADLTPFVEWKTSTGYNMNVVTTDVAGTTKEAIKTYITGLYNGANPPVYILMIGDSPTPLDTYTPSGGGTGGTDLPFVQLAGGDIYPDVFIARWPIDDSTELANMRNKILHYEQPTAGNSAWLDRALYLAGSDYASLGYTTHQDVIAELMEPPPNSADCDFWPHAQGATTTDLINDLNTGRAWMVYSSHCGPTGMNGNPPFYSGDVPNLANADQYPIGHGHCCQSNMWATNDDVFGEVMVNQPDKGFVSYWGGSNSTQWDGDDWLEKGFFGALFDAEMVGTAGDYDRLYSNIAACYAGLTEVTLTSTDDDAYYWPMYNLNGDPSLDPFTRAPIALNVTAPTVVPPVADTFTVSVADTAGAVPLAMVAVTQNGVLLGAGLADDTGVAVFPIDAPAAGSDLLVRVTAHNHLPTDATTLVAAGSDGVIVLDGTLYRCDSPVAINVFDDDLASEPPFNVTLSASPSGGSIPVQVSSVGVGVVQYQGSAVLGTDLMVAHGDVLTVTYADADTGTGPATKTDTAVLDCAGPVISGLGVHNLGPNEVTVRWTTGEPGSSWAMINPGGVIVTDAGLVTDHELDFEGLDPCASYTISVASTDALGNAGSGDQTGTFLTWTQSIAFTDDVESGVGSWTVDTDVDPGTGTNWGIVTDASASSPTHAWFTSDENYYKDDRLEAGPFALGGGSPVLSFWHHFDTESSYDGGVLEVSTDGTTWVDVVDAGGVFLAGAYNDTSSSYTSNPIGAGRDFWAGTGALQEVQVDLTSLAGGDLWIRFRFGCDGSVLGAGWWIDDIVIETSAPCSTVLFIDDFEIGTCGAWSRAVGELP